MVTLGEAGRSEEVLEYWRQLVCVQGMSGVDIRPDTYFLTLRNAVKVKAWDEVESIIGMMQVCAHRRLCKKCTQSSSLMRFFLCVFILPHLSANLSQVVQVRNPVMHVASDNHRCSCTPMDAKERTYETPTIPLRVTPNPPQRTTVNGWTRKCTTP